MLKRRSACILLALLLPSCTAGVSNDCLLQAYRAQRELPPGTWSRRLIVHYPGSTMGHAYMIHEEMPGHHIFAWDDAAGSRRIFPHSLRSVDVFRVVDPGASTGFYEEDTPSCPRLAR